MADAERTVEVICANVFHRGPIGEEGIGADFTPDVERGVAVAEVEPETARALLDYAPEAYRCPALEDDTDSGGADAADELPALDRLDELGGTREQKLARAGVETSGALLAAVPAELAEASGIAEDLITGWQDELRR